MTCEPESVLHPFTLHFGGKLGAGSLECVAFLHFFFFCGKLGECVDNLILSKLHK